MFGMLDYRAHKLYWLLTRPIWLLTYALLFAAILASCGIGIYFFENIFARLIVAYLAFQALSIMTLLLWKAIEWCFDRFFFFLVDLVPADSRSLEEAKLVLKGGDLAILQLKPVSQWTDDDCDLALRSTGWLGRLFFAERIRMRHRALREGALDWLARPDADGSELPEYEARQIIETAGLTPAWYELAVHKGYWRSLIINHLWFILIFALMQQAAR